MRNKLIVPVLGYLVALLGIVVLFGWWHNIAALKSVHPDWVTMKPLTANCFVLSGVILANIRKRHINDFAEIVLPAFGGGQFFVTFFLISSVFSDYSTGIENLFFREAESAVYTINPGMPSMGSTLCFLIIAVSGMVRRMDKHVQKTGIILMALAGSALAGYVWELPLLFFYIPGISTAMAIHTALAFLALGIGFFVVKR